jgi:hypothetical protein
MDVDCVDNVTNNLTSNEIEFQLEVMANANKNLKSTHNELVQG